MVRFCRPAPHRSALTGRIIALDSSVREFAQTVSSRAPSDLGRFLSMLLGALAKLERKAQVTGSAQARADQASLLSTADEYARLVNSLRVSHRVPLFDICADTDLKTPNKMTLSSRA